MPAKEEKKHSEPGLQVGITIKKLLKIKIIANQSKSNISPKIQGSWGVEPEFETELCDLKIEGGNQGGFLFLYVNLCVIWYIFVILRWRRKEGFAGAERGDGRGWDACRGH